MEQLGHNPATRSGGTRSVVAFTAIMVLGLTLVLSPLIVWLWPSKKEAVATYRPTVEVQDEAGVHGPRGHAEDVDGGHVGQGEGEGCAHTTMLVW